MDTNGVDDSELYQSCLRVAYLAYLTSPKLLAQSYAPPRPDSPGRSSRPISRHDAWTSALSSISDTFNVKDPKSLRFPKELIKVLGAKIERIARGADPSYSDILLRSTIGAFYGDYTADSFQRQIKDERKIETLILRFVTTAQNVLKKRSKGDEWKGQLNQQVGQFVNIIRECLRSRECKHAPPELISRLDAYSSKLIMPTNDHHETASSPSTSHQTLDATSGNVREMPMVQTVGRIFRIDSSQLQRDITEVKRICTERAAVGDMKALINAISQGASFPGTRTDFPSENAYVQWKQAEIATLGQLMLTMVKFHPDLVQSEESAHRSSVLSPLSPISSSLPSPLNKNGSLSGRPNSMAPSDSDHSYVFIPQDPKSYYRRLLDISLDLDIELIQSLGPDDEVSLQILSKAHVELLTECAIRWRITPPFRVTSFFDAISLRYMRGECPLIECVGEALTNVEKITNEWEYNRWPVQDRRYLFSSLSETFDSLLRRIFGIFKSQENVSVEEVDGLLELLSKIQGNLVFQEDILDYRARLEELKEGIGLVAMHHYSEQSGELFSTALNQVVPFFILLDWIKKTTKTLDKRFPKPILEAVDMPSIFLEKVSPLFLKDLDAAKSTFLSTADPSQGGVNDADIVDLYKGVLELASLHDAFCPNSPLPLDLTAWFEPFIRRWLDQTDAKTEGWVISAIKADQFVGEGQDQNSSSIVDLLDSCKSAIEFLQKLEWPDKYQNALYFTALSKTISKSMELYCFKIEELFMGEMFPRDAEAEASDVNRPGAWLTKARAIYQSDRKIETFQFTPQSCVKLNNIQAARNILDKMYSSMDADNVSAVVRSHRPAIAQKPEASRFLFTVKVIMGEGVAKEDGSTKVDPFLTLSDERGKRVAKTRTLYETNCPKWEETFDIPVQGSLWLAASIWHRNLVDEHEMLGRAYVCLDSRQFGNFLPQDLWFDLDTTGRIFMRISMEGEQDDIQFYFGKAFRSLKRAESDMVRNIVDKFSPIIHQYISLSNLKALLKTVTAFYNPLSKFDVEKARANVFDLYQKQFGSGSEIPPTEDEMREAALAKRGPAPKPMSDAEIEAAIGPVFEVLDAGLEVLKSSLSPEAWVLVTSKIWKEVLSTIESLLIPPLSDAPAEMKALDEKEVDIVFKLAQVPYELFQRWWYAITTSPSAAFSLCFSGDGIPIEDLQSSRFQRLLSIRLYYDQHADDLMEECVRLLTSTLVSKQATRTKSVINSRNIGTIKERKREKRAKKNEQSSGNVEIILRILRMRPGTQDFIQQQLRILHLQSATKSTSKTGAKSNARTGAANKGR
ncbi:hypothetical protein BT69DRAFT_1322630 [Atractiella rhizophila]|nr:hypothetical protein BT69DRAFT_1322630 [Atractiella rhizophila]